MYVAINMIKIDKNPVDVSISEYTSICGNNIKAELLRQKYTDDEIQLFVYEVKTQKEAIDTDNLFDVSLLEQLADLHIQMKRMIVLQKEILDDAAQMKLSDQPGIEEQSIKMKMEAVKLSTKLNECNDKCGKLIEMLDQAREQRAKKNLDQRISFTKIIKDLDEIKYKERMGKHGALRQKSLDRKKKEMIEQGLIIVAKDEKISEKVKIQEETKSQEES